MPRVPLLICLFAALTARQASAGYADDTGFTRLKQELGSAMPDTSVVGISQVEATPSAGAYLPVAGSGTFSGTGYWTGKTFTARSGPGLYSFHASDVGMNLYGANTDPSLYRASMCPGAAVIDCYNANTWDDEFLAPLPGRSAPSTESRQVQNHSWIHDATPATAAAILDLVRRQDFSINRDGYVCCAGLNNGPLSPVPDLMASAYNVISTGLTNGEHSRGGVTADMDGPARRKPEIVAPLDATSFSTAYVSSAAGLLYAAGTTANSRNARTLKAVLLAGATREEFPGWAKSADHPIDAVYGAGELNIYNSYHILTGGEQPAGAAGPLPRDAWDLLSLSAGAAADYRLTIPAGEYGVELSAFLVWNRTLQDSVGPGFNLTPDALVNFDLTLFRDPSAGGAAAVIDASTATLYNLEHVRALNLPAGHYRLHVSRGGGSAQTCAIAWRLATAPHQPQPVMTRSGAGLLFSFPGLIPAQPYQFQSSSDLQTWQVLDSFTAASANEARTLPAPAGLRRLYRLLPVLP